MRHPFYAWRFLLPFAAISLSGSSSAQTSSPNDLAHKIESILEADQAKGSLSGVVLVAKGNSEVFSKAYGDTDRAQHIPNTLTTPFRILSLSKQFTVAAILRLQEQGKLSTDAPVSAYLTDLPRSWQQVTLKQLMTHTSGIPNFTEGDDFMAWGHQDHTPEELIGRVRTKPIVFAPGTRWRYSNTNYVLLGLIIQHVSGRPLQDFLSTNFFQPLRMQSTTTYNSPMHGVAQGYVEGKEGVEPAPELSMTLAFAAGQLVSTAPDLLKWERALYSGRVLNQKSLQELLTPTQVSGVDRYAEGLTLADSTPESRVESHIGLFPGLTTYMAHADREDVVVVLLENLENAREEQPDVLGKALLNAALR